jgi:hypothetical protein
MTVRKDRKVPGGKLLRVEVALCDGVAQRVLVRGDFFAHPEELFEAAETALSGVPVRELERRVRELFGAPALRIFGASSDDIAAAIMEAVHEAQAD